MSASHTDRIDLRIKPDSKKLIARAAELLGVSLSSFAVATLVEKAQSVVDKHATIRMGDRDRDRFLEMMDNPPAANAALRRVARKHRERIGE